MILIQWFCAHKNCKRTESGGTKFCLLKQDIVIYSFWSPVRSMKLRHQMKYERINENNYENHPEFFAYSFLLSQLLKWISFKNKLQNQFRGLCLVRQCFVYVEYPKSKVLLDLLNQIENQWNVSLLSSVWTVSSVNSLIYTSIERVQFLPGLVPLSLRFFFDIAFRILFPFTIFHNWNLVNWSWPWIIARNKQPSQWKNVVIKIVDTKQLLAFWAGFRL